MWRLLLVLSPNMTTHVEEIPPTQSDAKLVNELLGQVVAIARNAGELALRLGTEALNVATKSSPTDLVTNADIEVEQYVVEAIAALERSHAGSDSIEAEEGNGSEGSSPFRWFLDPIDGTTDFVYGRPQWSVSLAVAKDGVVVAGAVYAPALGAMYAAGQGLGATLNGQPIDVGLTSKLSLALVGTGFSYSAATRARQGEVLRHVLPRVRDIRRSGSAALEMCFVADGKSDAFYEAGLGNIDTSAAVLIIEEAGGTSEALPLENGIRFACNTKLVEPFRMLLTEAAGIH
jgi:myo-inositol-1(or 4)-monophosphatase